MSDEVSEQGDLFCRKFDWLAGAQHFIAADVYSISLNRSTSAAARVAKCV